MSKLTLLRKVGLVVLPLRIKAVTLNWLELISALMMAVPMLPVDCRRFVRECDVLWGLNCIRGRERTYTSNGYVLDCHYSEFGL